MESYQKLCKAIDMATRAHAGQFRKFGPPGAKLPYIAHPVRVMTLLQQLAFDEDVLAAAMLHDVLEDQGDKVTPHEIKAELGEEVQLLVLEMTNPTHTPEWEGRPRDEKKAADRAKLIGVSRTAKVIKLADRLDNIRELLEQVSFAPRGFVANYVPETRLLLETIGNAHPYLTSAILEICEELDAHQGVRAG